MKNNKATIFNVILDTFENEDIKELTVKMIDDIPDYFFDIGHPVQENIIHNMH